MTTSIRLLRLSAHGLGARRFPSVADCVRAMGALQAQDYPAGLWAVGVRTAGATEAAVEAAISGRQLVRTWPMRGTLHLIPAEDARWMLALTAQRGIAKAQGRLRQLGIDNGVLSASREALARSLAGGRRLTRPQAHETLAAAGIPTDGQRGIHILNQLAQEAFLCLGPREGRQHTWVLFDEWLPEAPARPRDESLATLAGRYFRGHGPATARDFAWWTGLTLAEASRGLEMAAGSLASLERAGVRYWHAPDAEPAPATATALLPPFDEYILGYRDRTTSLEADGLARVFPRANGMFLAAALIDGEISATWAKSVRSHDAVSIELRPWRALPAGSASRLEDAVARYAEFLGAERPSVVVRPPEDVSGPTGDGPRAGQPGP